METFVCIRLTDDQLRDLDDGQEWYTIGRDTVYIGGYLPDDDNPNPSLDLSVNGTTHDNWLHWADAPDWLTAALLRERDNG